MFSGNRHADCNDRARFGRGLADRTRLAPALTPKLLALMLLAVTLLVVTLLTPILGPGHVAHASAQEAAPTVPAVPDAPAAPGADSHVVINEILAHTDEPEIDTVELYNPAGSTAYIGGWCLSDKEDEPCLYRFPVDTTIPAFGYDLVDENEWNAGLAEADHWRLSEMGETLYLSQAVTGTPPAGYQHAATFGANANGVSLGRVMTSDGREFFPPLRSLTLGGPNDLPAVGPVVIAEIMYLPADSALPEYMEVLNTGASTVRLYDPAHPENRWRVDGVGGNFSMPAGLQLAGGESLFLTNVSADAFRTAWSLPPSTKVLTYSGKLSDKSDEIALLQPDTPNLDDGLIPYLTVDGVDYTNSYPWPKEAAGQGPALQRAQLDGFGQEPGNWQASQIGLLDAPAIALKSFTESPWTSGSRILQWTTAYEWKGIDFRLLRSETTELSDAEPVGGSVPGLGGRHMGHNYAVYDASATQPIVYHYWLQWQSEEGVQLIAQLDAQIWQSHFLPLVKQN